MSDKLLKFPELSKEIRSLVSDGIYSLYSLEGSGNFILITDTDEKYLMDCDGLIVELVKEPTKYTISEPININDLEDPTVLKVNFA